MLSYDMKTFSLILPLQRTPRWRLWSPSWRSSPRAGGNGTWTSSGRPATWPSSVESLSWWHKASRRRGRRWDARPKRPSVTASKSRDAAKQWSRYLGCQRIRGRILTKWLWKCISTMVSCIKWCECYIRSSEEWMENDWTVISCLNSTCYYL